MTVTHLQAPPTTSRMPAGRSGEPRWTPTRAGIVNVWRYYDETFHFHRGRLLLRGPNGTGKSKALELLLPYLLDANLRPNRLSTFGGTERTMHWNLMGEGASGTTRVGYVWLEFRHPGPPDPGGATREADETRTADEADRADDEADRADDEADSDQWFCCGARLQASVHTTSVTADYFTTTGRIGLPSGPSLVDEANAPLSRKRLAEVLGDTGTVHESAADYRAAVRTTLFSALSEQRYDALITAMLQLRTPKLSERLDPSLLSTLLSRALPPLGSAEIAELAEGFERLDDQHEQLSALDKEVEAAQLLANRQRSYAERVLKAAAARLVSATTELDKLTRAARLSQEEYERVVASVETTATRQEDLSQQRGRALARVDGLTASETYQRGGELDELRRQQAAATRSAAAARREGDKARLQAQDDERHAAQAKHDVELAERATDAAAGEARRAADRAGMPGTYEDVQEAATSSSAPGGGPPPRASARQLLRAAVDGRRRQVADVRRALEQHQAAVGDRERAEAELESAREDLAEAATARDAAQARNDSELAALADRIVQWTAGCAELTFDDPTALVDLIETEADVVSLVESVAGRVLETIAAEEQATGERRRLLGVEQDALSAERATLLAAAELPPAAPPTRASDRSALPGAPLWRLVSFRDEIDAGVQAGVEAALEAAGLLDAWFLPAGGIKVPGHDTVVEAELATPVPAPGRSLDDVLVPEPDGAVPAARVRQLLAGVAFGPTLPDGHPVAVAADGHWRLAAAHGSWTKPEAAHIGALARDRARQRRIAELTAMLDELDLAVGSLDDALAALAGRRTRVADDRRGRPGHQALTAARASLEQAESAVAARSDVVNRSLGRLSERQAAVAAALRRLTTTGAEHGLPTHAEALAAVDAAVVSLQALGDAWLDYHHTLVAARDRATRAGDVARRSRDSAAALESSAAEHETEAMRLREKVAGVEAAIGPDYRVVLDEIDTLRTSAKALETEEKTLGLTLRELEKRAGTLDTRRTVDSELRDAAVASRDQSATRFRSLAVGTLGADARVELTLTVTDGVRATLDAARALVIKLANTPTGLQDVKRAEGRLADAVHTARQALADRAELTLEPDDDVQALTATIGGVRVGAAHLCDTLRGERDRARDDITDRERELFDRTLTGNTRRHVAERIRQANGLVAEMNSRLERVRTASRIAVRLVWQVDPALPEATKTARDLLLKDTIHLTEADREALHRFLRDRVDEARGEDTATSWEAQLLRVFDYTAWHQFVVKIDRANGSGWLPLTKKLHGALSGGEKAIALHLPLFAALAAHYQSTPGSPRLILLDEVFVGVDSMNRGQVFDLLASLDLDLMLTSDHEWCTYRELDGIAVHQLVTGGDGSEGEADGADPVTTARFVWDGFRLDPDGVPT